MAEAKGYGAARAYNVPLGTETYVFEADGIVPNNPLPLIVRRGAVSAKNPDRASSFETTFAKNGWTNSWRAGIFDFTHYHSTAHEVLGIVSGAASVCFGGENGELVGLTAGDVVVIPAGVAHALINHNGDLLVVGAYADGRDWDVVRDEPDALVEAQKRIAAVPLPDADPIDGGDGPLVKLWR